MNSITMKDMSTEDFKSLSDDLNVHLLGFIAECNKFGYDPQAAWIIFVDSDDWVDKDFCEVPNKAAKAHNADADMVVINTI